MGRWPWCPRSFLISAVARKKAAGSLLCVYKLMGILVTTIGRLGCEIGSAVRTSAGDPGGVLFVAAAGPKAAGSGR